MSGRKEFRDLASPAAVRETIASLPIEPGTETVSLAESRGRVLAERIDASIDVPGFDRASMDGYAVRSADTVGADERDPVILEVAGTVHAGQTPEVSLTPGRAIEISTGAVLPPRADSVIIVERTHETDAGVAIEAAVAPGANVMTAGTDIGAGQRATGPGRLLAARDIALLAALGRESVRVRRRPRVGIISTGDELVRPGEPIDHGRGQIHDVNGHALAAAVSAAGGVPILYPTVGDDEADMHRVLDRGASECDLVMSSGSTSASAVDVIYHVVADRGEVLHHGVALKPGKPMVVGRMGEDEAAYIGLPGYPVSALMVFRRFVAPRLREVAALPPAADPTLDATLIEDARFGEGRTRLLPVGLVHDGGGAVVAYPVDKGSGATTSLVDADGVVEVPADTEYVATDERVTVHLFDRMVRPPSLLGVGEDDPAFARILDELSHTRYLPVGSREGARRFERGIPDVAVVRATVASGLDGESIGRWRRSWGLIVPADHPAGVRGVEDLVEADVTLANVAGTGIRAAFDEHLDRLAEARGLPMSDLTGAIDGYGVNRPTVGSAAQRVADGAADVGLGLSETADRLGLEFLPIDTQEMVVLANPSRRQKPGVKAAAATLEQTLSEITDALAGYEVID